MIKQTFFLLIIFIWVLAFTGGYRVAKHKYGYNLKRSLLILKGGPTWATDDTTKFMVLDTDGYYVPYEAD